MTSKSKLFSGMMVLSVMAVFFTFIVVVLHRDMDLELAKPEMPISIRYRRAGRNQHPVALFRNESDQDITVLAFFERPEPNESKAFPLHINPKQTAKFGFREGWAFQSGDHVRLHNGRFMDQVAQIP